MEETLSNSRFIVHHRQQINPQADPESTLTFAYGSSKYSKYPYIITNSSLFVSQTRLLDK